MILIKISPREVSKYGVFFWSVFSCIWTEYGDNLRIQSKYRKIGTRENSIFGQFLHSVFFLNFTCNKFCDFTKIAQKREF